MKQDVGRSHWDGTSDVIVVGGGAAGLFAAIEAADARTDTVILESEPERNGSARLSAGYVTLCETEMQPGRREELFEDLMESHHGDCDRDLVRVYVDRAAETYSRMKALGIRFMRTFQFAHMRRPWAHELSGESMGLCKRERPRLWYRVRGHS